MKTFYISIITAVLLISCNIFQGGSSTKRISEFDAKDIMSREVGNHASGPNLYPYYLETYTVIDELRYDYAFLIQIDRVFGNEVEGKIGRYDGYGEIVLPFIGKYNNHQLYIYTGGYKTGSVYNKKLIPQDLLSEHIMVFNISPDKRYLTRAMYAWSMIDGVVQWFQEPPYNVNISDGYNRTLIFNSTGFYFSQVRPPIMFDDPNQDGSTSTRESTEIIDGADGRDNQGVRNSNENGEEPRGNTGVRSKRD